MAKTISPPMINIVAADVDTNLLTIPAEKVFKATNLRISNQAAAAARVRIWDTFTDSDSVTHSSSAAEVKKIDIELIAGETVVITDENGIFDAIGALVAQSSLVGAEPDHVAIGISGQFEP